MSNELRIALATPLDEDLCQMVERLEPRVQLIRDHSLLPPQRHAGDHYGEVGWRRPAHKQAKFEQMLKSADAIYGIPDLSTEFLGEVVRENRRLRWVQAMAAGAAAQVRGAGFEEPDVAHVAFTTSAGVHAKPLAEFAAFGVLAGAKQLPTLLANQRERNWSPRRILGQLAEQRVLVVGLGSIGAETARILTAFGMTVVGANRTERQVPGIDRKFGLDDLVRAADGCSALVVALPGHTSTDRLVDRQVLDALNPSATVVNVGRGTVIDEPALVDAAKSGQVGFVTLDVTAVEPLPPESPLWDMPNVLLSPHTAALSTLEDERIARLVADNAGRLLDGKPLRNLIPLDQITNA